MGVRPEHLHQRVESLLAQFPYLEKLLERLIKEISDAPIEDVDINKLVDLYLRISKFYNDAVELVRKIYIYFPQNLSNDARELLNLYNRLPYEDKVKLIIFLRKKVLK